MVSLIVNDTDTIPPFSDSIVYIGRTRDYVFVHNLKINQTNIYPTRIVSNIQAHDYNTYISNKLSTEKRLRAIDTIKTNHKDSIQSIKN